MIVSATLTLDLKSTWHASTGRGTGPRMDAVVAKTATGLPLLPGRTLKGLIRDAVNRWEIFGHGTAHTGDKAVSITDQLFGPRGIEGAETFAGLLRFSNALLEPDTAAYLASEEGASLRSGLYGQHISTAIDARSGTALDASLRSIETTIPLTLTAQIDEIGNARYDALSGRWLPIIDAALPLIRSIGSNRSRGFGRCTMTVVSTA